MSSIKESKVAVSYQLLVSQNDREIYLVSPSIENQKVVIKLEYEHLLQAIKLRDSFDELPKLTAMPQTSTPILS